MKQNTNLEMILETNAKNTNSETQLLMNELKSLRIEKLSQWKSMNNSWKVLFWKNFVWSNRFEKLSNLLQNLVEKYLN